MRVDEEGHLVLPPDLAERLGLVDGALVRVEERDNAVAFGRSSASLARVYVEPTTLCNLRCRTCIRNVWDEQPGTMSAATFARVMDGVREVSPRPTVFFGGFGEPLAHPDLPAMLATAAGRQGDGRANVCPFVEKGSVSVRWDGAISPCLPLLHTHRSYLDFRPRTNHAFALANVNDRGLLEVWDDPAYVELRERLQAFDFAPCTTCNSCDMADENLENCFGSPTPACGGCLWAQGFIQCP